MCFDFAMKNALKDLMYVLKTLPFADVFCQGDDFPDLRGIPDLMKRVGVCIDVESIQKKLNVSGDWGYIKEVISDIDIFESIVLGVSESDYITAMNFDLLQEDRLIVLKYSDLWDYVYDYRRNTGSNFFSTYAIFVIENMRLIFIDRQGFFYDLHGGIGNPGIADNDPPRVARSRRNRYGGGTD